MKFLEVLGKILVFLIGTGAVVALVWAICCSVSPTVSQKTEDLLNGTKQEEVAEDTDNQDTDNQDTDNQDTDNQDTDNQVPNEEDVPNAVTPEVNSQFVFENDLIKISISC